MADSIASMLRELSVAMAGPTLTASSAICTCSLYIGVCVGGGGEKERREGREGREGRGGR